MYKKWTDTETEYLINNYLLKSCKTIAKDLNITYRRVVRKIAKLKLIIPKHVLCKRISESRCNTGKYQSFYNEIININKPEIAYLLGFLWADGTIRSGQCLSFNINKDDFDVLSNIFYKFGNWSIRKLKNKNIIQGYIFDKRLLEYLRSLNFYNKSRDTARLLINTIPENLRFYWWRGYFDGDGCFYHHTNQQNKHYYSVSIASTYEQNWEFLKLLPNIGGKISRIIYKIGKGSYFIISDIKNIKMFLDYIYNNRENDKIGLSRKYLKYKNFNFDLFASRRVAKLDENTLQLNMVKG